jgi:CRP-like cAMP-binding protein
MSNFDQPHPERHRLIRKLESIAELSSDDKEALLSLPMRVKDFPADTDVVSEGDRPSECCLVLDGFVCRYKILSEGKRQILSFHTPGDIPDLQSLYLKVMDHSLGTLVPTKVALIPHQSVIDLTRRFPRLAAALWRDTLIDAAIFREWVVNVGRRNAYQRVAHLICEMALRFKAVGLAKDHTYTLPVTQEELGDATGLSLVHINRTLMRLRGDGLISWRGSTITALDWEGLKQAGGFDPAYLHQDRDQVAA